MSARVPAILFCALAAAILAYLYYSAQPPHLNPRDTLFEEFHWRERIGEVGGVEAYRELARAIAAFSPQRQHQAAHAFGGALFDAAGVESLGVCDSRFSFGCFHEFLGRAIKTLGLSSVKSLDEACFETVKVSPLSCTHGLGHGIVAYLGYDETAMRRSLEVCREVLHYDPIGGCYGGVFMEYNTQTMLGDEGRLRQPVNNDILAPCNALDDAYKKACFFWQPQWWHLLFTKQENRGLEESYGRMGTECERMGAETKWLDLVDVCFNGIGNIVPPDADFDGSRARKLCEATSESKERQLACKTYAANSLFVGGAGKRGDAKAVCDGLSGESHDMCLQYGSNRLNISNDRNVRTIFAR